MFRDLSGIVQGAKLHIDRKSSSIAAECSIEVVGSDQFHDVLKLIKKISKYQQVLITWLCIQHATTKEGYIARMLDMRNSRLNDRNLANMEESGPERLTGDSDTDSFLKEMMKDAVDLTPINDEFAQDLVADDENMAREIDQLITKYVVLSKDIRAMRFENCDMSAVSSNYIFSQLHGCNKMTELDISSVKEIPKELGDAVSCMPSLRMVTICNAKQSAAKGIMSGLASCQRLEMLHLNGNTLTGAVENLFGNSNQCGFPSLTFLHLSATEISAADVEAIATATHNGKLPTLKQIGTFRQYLDGLD